MLRAITKIAAVTLAFGVASLAATVARGDDVDATIKLLTRLDQRVHIMALEFNEAPGEGVDAPDRRIVDAEGLLRLGRPDEAMTLLLDVLARWPETPAACDAGFLLADALFALGDFLSARHAYETAVAAFTGTSREQRAVVRLIEIALRTGDFAEVDHYLGLLARVQGVALDASVAYVKGKVLYFRDDLDEATRAFASIGPGSGYHWRARYFIATILVKRGDLLGAARAYEALLRAAAPDEGAQEIQDLARLALGRINYQQGNPQRATVYYLSIPAGSKALPAGLYELGWTYVRAKEFEKARDAFARLLVLQPAGPQAPELKLLLGNLHLRQGDLGVARRAFLEARDELEPTYKNLQAAIAKSQADAHDTEVSGQRLDQIDLAAFVPASARQWVRADPEIDRLLVLAGDVVGAQQGVADAIGTLGSIQDVLANADPVMLFPELGRVGRRSTQTLAVLIQMRGRFLGRARRLEQPYLLEPEARSLDRFAAQQAAIEQQIGLLLSASAPFGQELVRGAPDSPGEPASSQLGQLRAAVLQLVGPHPGDQYGIADAARAARSAVTSATRASALDTRLQQLTVAEAQIQRQVLARMGSVPRAALDRELEVVARVDAAATQLFALDARVAAEGDLRLVALKRLVADRRQDVAALERRLATVVGQAQSLGGNLTRLMYTRVADRLYDLIVRADVGLVDVAWAVKDRSSLALQVLVTRKNQELNLAENQRISAEAAIVQRFKLQSKSPGRLAPPQSPREH